MAEESPLPGSPVEPVSLGRPVGVTRSETTRRSFVDAAWDKFHGDMAMDDCIGIYVPKKGPAKITDSGHLILPWQVHMNNCGITEAGQHDDMSSMCRNVTELDLAQNNITSLEEVIQVIHCMPQLTFLNLTNNPLHSSSISLAARSNCCLPSPHPQRPLTATSSSPQLPPPPPPHPSSSSSSALPLAATTTPTPLGSCHSGGSVTPGMELEPAAEADARMEVLGMANANIESTKATTPTPIPTPMDSIASASPGGDDDNSVVAMETAPAPPSPSVTDSSQNQHHQREADGTDGDLRSRNRQLDADQRPSECLQAETDTDGGLQSWNRQLDADQCPSERLQPEDAGNCPVRDQRPQDDRPEMDTDTSSPPRRPSPPPPPPPPPPGVAAFSTLRQLVLNDTGVEWRGVVGLLRLFPSLEELHLSLNHYQSVDIPENFVYPSLLRLFFNNSDVRSWSHICCLGRSFPQLQHLFLAETPIACLTTAEEEKEKERKKEGGERGGGGRGEKEGGGSEGGQREGGTGGETGRERDEEGERAGREREGRETEGRETEGEERKVGETEGGELEEEREVGETEGEERTEREREGKKEEETVGGEREGGERGGEKEGEERGRNAMEALFPSLELLSLNKTQLRGWGEVDRLKRFPRLCDVRLLGIPFLETQDPKLRRHQLVARLPNISRLNGSAVTPEERLDAERAFIRLFMDQEDKPQRYQELVEIHGELEPLVKVDFTPKTIVKVFVVKEEQREPLDLNTNQTVRELKKSLQNVAGMPSSQFHLFYLDKQSAFGADKLKYLDKKLYTYNVSDGDEFIIEPKQLQLKDSKEM